MNAALGGQGLRPPGRWPRWGTLTLNLLLAGFIAWQVSGLARLWLAPEAAPVTAAPAVELPATPAPAGTRLPPPGLFGTAAAHPPAGREQIRNAPETRLQLTLRGIFATRQAEHGLALIQDEHGNEKHFRVGGEVFGQATVDSIHEDRVILLRNGHYETLTLPRESLGIVIEPEIARKRGETFAQLRRDFLSGNVMKLLQLVGADTAYDERGFIGFRLVAFTDEGRNLLEEVGLAPGDIVTHIDDVEIAANLDAVRAAVARLRDGRMTSIAVNRDGRHIELSIELPELEPVDALRRDIDDEPYGDEEAAEGAQDPEEAAAT